MEKTKLPYLRIKKISLKDFRNIKQGEVELPNSSYDDFKDGKPSVLGLYGQNGSGKTSLLMAINILKTVLCGQSLKYSIFASAIREGCMKCGLSFDFIGYNDKDNEVTDITYEFCVEKSLVEDDADDSSAVVSSPDKGLKEPGISFDLNLSPNKERLIITNEVLWYKPRNSNGRKQRLVDTRPEECAKKAFGPKAKYESLTKNAPKEIHEFFTKMRTVAEERSVSFIFNDAVFHNLMVATRENKDQQEALYCLNTFGGAYLFIIGSEETGLNNIKELPLMLRKEDNEGVKVLLSLLRLKRGCSIEEKFYNDTRSAIDALNTVLSKLIPRMNLRCIDRGIFTDKDSKEMHRFDLLSDRDGVRIPFEYESDGIRRIVSFLSLLISVYNDPSFTLAIDEIDSGIFEYLLGEIISIMGKNARGQLIFTSHNLRPLEVLPTKYLMFTSINPENRFVKLEGVGGNNNLRDCYFRYIVLGSGKNAIYETTDTFDIEEALFEAGYHEEFDNTNPS